MFIFERIIKAAKIIGDASKFWVCKKHGKSFDPSKNETCPHCHIPVGVQPTPIVNPLDGYRQIQPNPYQPNPWYPTTDRTWITYGSPATSGTTTWAMTYNGYQKTDNHT